MTGERVIRTRSKVEREAVEKENYRPVSELENRIISSSESVHDIAEDLETIEVKALIDHAFGMQETAKELDERVSQIKAVLKQWGSLRDRKELDGLHSGAMKISAKSTTTTKGATELVRLLKKLGKLKAADTILSVKVGEAKKYLGETMLREEKFMETETDDFGALTLKKMAKKKKK